MLKRLVIQLYSIRLLYTLTALQKPSSINNQICSGNVLVLPLAYTHAFGATNRDESKDTLGVIDRSARASKRNAPTCSESVVML
jgi:hypothetical protein